MRADDELSRLLNAELDGDVADAVRAMAESVADRFPGSRSVVHYGSTLRSGRLEGELVDFYVIVEDYACAFDCRWLAAANRLLPPNVFAVSHGDLRAKVAVLDRRDLRRLTGADAASVSVWARFCQPLRLAWVRDEAARDEVAAAARRSVLTMMRTAAPMMVTPGPLSIWRTGLSLTYGAELRAERRGRVDQVVDAAPGRYRRLALAAGAELGWRVDGDRLDAGVTPGDRVREERRWRRRRLAGKGLTLARLAKAAATYGGGIEYLADKIERHSGVAVPLRPWQRRVPLLGALWLLPSLIRTGAVR